MRAGLGLTRRIAARTPRRLRAAVAARTIEERLVWIFGSPRSGSTWLLRVLADQEAVVPINEPNLGWYLGPFLSDLPGFGSDGLGADNFTLRKAQDHNPSEFFGGAFRDAWEPSFRRMICERFAAHAVRYPPRGAQARRAIVVLKEPNGSQSADMIMAALPRSRLLFLLRDGRDVVDSELAGHLPRGWVTTAFPGARGIEEEDRLPFVEQSARKWLWRTETVQRAFADHSGPKLLVRYEDLLADTHGGVRSILDWLGLEMSEADLAETIARASFEAVPAEWRGSREFNRAATPGLWRENLRAEEQAAVQAILGPKLRELGYAG